MPVVPASATLAGVDAQPRPRNLGMRWEWRVAIVHGIQEELRKGRGG